MEPSPQSPEKAGEPVDTRLAGVRPGSRDDALLLVLAAWQLLLHVTYAVRANDVGMWPAHTVSFLHDLLLLVVMRGVLKALRGLTPGRVDGPVRVGAVVLPLVLGALLALYPQLLREYLAYPVNIFAASGGSAKTLLTQYLGLSRLWPSAVAAVLLALAYRSNYEPSPSRRAGWVIGTVVLSAGLLLAPASPHPIVHSLSLQASDALARGPRVVPSLPRPPAREGPAPEGPPLLAPNAPLLADHVFMLVLESVTAEAFEREFLTIPGGFASRVGRNAMYFANHFTTNQDSYTALVAMLTGELVPYRAYTNPTLYERVNTAPNLARALRQRGYETTFVSTYAHQPYVPVRGDWSAILDRTNLGPLESFVEAGTSRMERATEDRAALATILAKARAAPRTFVLHELVYGHSSEWQAKTGLGTLAYDDQYLRELLDGLAAAGLSETSLLVVVSDHGDRSKSFDVANYRVPLLVTGAHVRPEDDQAFRTHLELPRIIASFLTGTPLPPPRTDTHLVGSTERWVYGTLDPVHGSLFIDDKHGTVLAREGALSPQTEHLRFQALRDDFARRFGP